LIAAYKQTQNAIHATNGTLDILHCLDNISSSPLPSTEKHQASEAIKPDQWGTQQENRLS
jgi:hypothetical protein